MKRARPKNKKAAQRLMRQREIEYLKRQRDELDKKGDEESELLDLPDYTPGDLEETDQAEMPDVNTEESSQPEDVQKYVSTDDELFDAEKIEKEVMEELEAEQEEPQSEMAYDEPSEEVILDEQVVDYPPMEETEDDLPEITEEQSKDDIPDEEEPFEGYIPEDEFMEGDIPDGEEASELGIPDEEDPKPEEEPFSKEDRVPTDIALDLPKKPKKKKKRSAKTFFKVLIGVMIALIAFIFIILGFGLFDETDILAPLEDGKINVLLMGVDESGLRSDAIMVASYNVNEGKINMLSIPRDTKVYVQNRKMTRKINEIHAISSKDDAGYILGTQAVAESVTALTGIPINYYVEFSFASIDHLFDIIGPVEFDVPDVEGEGRGMNYDDPYQDLHIHLKPGLQELSGNQIQQFLRYRKSNSGVGTGSDTDRVLRQQDFVKAVIDQKVSLSTLIKLPSIFSQLSQEIKTNISINDITKYIRYFNKLSAEGITSYSLPGEPQNVGGGSYFVCNLEETKTLMRDVFGFDAEVSDKVTLSEKNPQKPLKVTYVTATPEPTKEPDEEETPEPTKEPDEEEEEEPTKAPVVTKEPTKAPEVTKEPTKAPTSTPEATEEPEDEIIIL